MYVPVFYGLQCRMCHISNMRRKWRILSHKNHFTWQQNYWSLLTAARCRSESRLSVCGRLAGNVNGEVWSSQRLVWRSLGTRYGDPSYLFVLEGLELSYSSLPIAANPRDQHVTYTHHSPVDDVYGNVRSSFKGLPRLDEVGGRLEFGVADVQSDRRRARPVHQHALEHRQTVDGQLRGQRHITGGGSRDVVGGGQ